LMASLPDADPVLAEEQAGAGEGEPAMASA
jgi:hypothetical protein